MGAAHRNAAPLFRKENNGQKKRSRKKVFSNGLCDIDILYNDDIYYY